VDYGDIEQCRSSDTSVAADQQRPAADSRFIRESADEVDV
jgi:hypothetical protein